MVGDDGPVNPHRSWPTYLGVTGFLLVLVVMLAGGLIWYNAKKASSFAITAAKQLMQETEDQITDRIKLLYEPMFAIVGVGSLVPEFTTPAIKGDVEARRLMLRGLGIYPQILSLYVGFDSGDFLMVTRIAGAETASLRERLSVPPNTEFAVEIVGESSVGERIMVPIDEIEQPILDIRNETLLYSIAFLVFALPLYVTLIVAWIDRRPRGSVAKARRGH